MKKVFATGMMAALVLAAAADTAYAQRTRRQSGTWERGNGNSGNWNRQAQTQKGRRDVQVGATDARGRSAEHARTLEKTGQGTANVSTQSRGFGGKTMETQGAVARTENGAVSSGTYTTGQGRTGTYETEVTRGDGARQVDTSYTTASGKSGTVSKTRTRDGRTVKTEGTATGPNGRTRSGRGSATVDR